ncbi:hypothetical protein QCA50_008705 [Cerrena zonata]|uniref:Autophagy-related protein 4 n=1 Tax=Cerrena zonata TaxID=2478898 RepID=A0AAW0G4T0_9APHY
MSRPERGSQSPSSPSTSKLPKFLQKTSRDRSRSMVDPSSSSTIASSSSSPILESSKSTSSRQIGRNSGKKLFGSKDEKRRQSQDIVLEGAGPSTPNSERERTSSPDVVGPDEPPVIVEPLSIPRPRTRSERPLSENYPVSYYPSSSNSRISDLPSRLSGWFSHTFSTSSTDLTLPSLISQQHLNSVASPSKGKGAAALLTAAKHGKGHLDKAMRYLLDSDATPDKSTDPIWILGIEHIGYEPPSPVASPNGRRTSVDSRRSPSSYRSSPPPDPSLSQSQPPSAKRDDPGRHWPPVFYADFTSRIWLTYRSQFHPIRDTTIEELEAADAAGEPGGIMSASPPPKRWNWPLGDKSWSSDAGWGCMLRTGQSLLANTLLHLHLGRDWRKPPYPIYTADYATYVQILTWFLDDPSPLCPFSVHRMALVGKQLGVRVGQWFGPSTAAGAIKKLVHGFPEAGLGVYVAADGGSIYESEVFAASHSGVGSPRRSNRSWGDRAVLVLIGHRLGLDGVNPIYYDTLKELYTWPQGVGIAGGRPSSSYYFVGSQEDNLFYLDPHHARPAIPLRPPRLDEVHPSSASRQTSPEPAYSSDRERDRMPKTPLRHVRSPTTPTSIRSSTGSNSSAFSHRGIPSPSPLQQQISTSTTSSAQSSGSHARWQSSSIIPDGSSMDSRELEGDMSGLDAMQRHYVTAYSHAELKTFHCDRVRKMPLSGLDPSMLMGFLCKDEQDWVDFRHRVSQLSKRSHKATVITIQDEPPNWTSDSEMDLRSMSDHDIDIDLPEEDDEDEMSSSGASRAASVSSPDTSISAQGGGDTEDDPLGPITPGAAKLSFDLSNDRLSEKMNRSISGRDEGNSLSFDDEEDEEWLDTSETPQTPLPTWTAPSVAQHQQRHHAVPLSASRSSSSSISRESSASAESAPPRERRRTKKSTSSGHTITRTSSSHHSQLPSQSQQPQYPFPATHPEEDLARQATPNRVPKMRTAVARDGGRTQSGGVRGLIPDDTDDT